MKGNTRCALVVGSHRAGTSVLTRALRTLGVFLGEDFFNPQFGNPKGFFEDRTANQLNEVFLHTIGSRWNTLLLPEHVDGDAVSAYQHGLRENVIARFQEEPLWGLKDPRISRLWPYWLSVFAEAGVQPVFILAGRHPFSVARSLFKRDRMPEAQALALWAVHQLEALEALLQYGGLVVDYDLLMDHPGHELQRIAAFLDVQSLVDPKEAAAFEDEFLAHDFRHSRYGAGSVAADTSPLQALCLEMHRELSALAQLPGGLSVEGGEHERVQGLLTGWRNELARFREWMLSLDAVQAALDHQASRAISRPGTECEARLFLGEIVDDRPLTYTKQRSVTDRYVISGRRQTLRLPMPVDLLPLRLFRLDPADRPVALVLHHMALVQEDGTKLWRWNGGAGMFAAPAGVVFRAHADGLLVLALNAEPRFGLAVPAEVLPRVTPDACLVIELTPRALPGAVSGLLRQNDRLIAELRSE